MRILLWEIKKMLDFKIVAAAVFACIVAISFLRPFSQLIWVSHSCWEADAIALYGANLSQDERAEIEEALIPKYIEEINTYVAANKDFTEIGVYDYESLAYFKNVTRQLDYAVNDPEYREMLLYSPEYNFHEKYGLTEADVRPLTDKEEAVLYEHLITRNGVQDELVNLLDKIESLPAALERYDSDKAEYAMKSGFAAKRDAQILESEEINNIAVNGAPIHITQAVAVMAAVCIGCVFLLLLPSVTKDSLCCVHQLQLSSKCGRKICTKRLCAMLIIAFAVTTVLMIITAYNLYKYIPSELWQSRLNSFNGFNEYSARYWFSGTLLQYTLVITAVVYVLSAAAAISVYLLSQTSKNYIALILKGLPSAALLILFDLFVLFGAMHYQKYDGLPGFSLSYLVPFPFIDIIAVLAVFAGISALFSRFYSKFKKADIF